MKSSRTLSFKNISPTIRFFTLADAMVTAGLGLFGPIFAVFIAERIDTVNALEVIGIGTSIYLFTRSIGQIPLAYLIDKIKGERDDFWVLFCGSLLMIFIPLAYILVTQPWHLFLIQFFFGIAGALTYPTWLALFTRHIDKGREGMEWGMYQTIVDLSGAIAAPIGGFVAAYYGFTAVMVAASALALLNSIFIYASRRDLGV